MINDFSFLMVCYQLPVWEEYWQFFDEACLFLCSKVIITKTSASLQSLIINHPSLIKNYPSLIKTVTAVPCLARVESQRLHW